MLKDLLDRGEGLQIVALPPSPKGVGRTLAPPQEDKENLTARRSDEGAAIALLREAFGKHLWIGASLTYGVDMRGGLARRVALARAVGAPLIATNDALMHAPERRALADVLACIREKTTLEAAGRLTQANAERHLKDPREMARLFAEAPHAVAETIRFIDGLSSASTNSLIAIRKNCAKAMQRLRRRSKPSPGRARERAIRTAFRSARAKR